MKKLIILAITLLSLQLTTYASTSNDKNEEMLTTELKNNTQYKNAMQFFKKKNYQKSFTLLQVLLEKYPNNRFINFYYGRSAFELKNYEYAFSAYDKILINQPSDSRTRAEFARTLMMLKSYEEAKVEFNKILLTPIPATVRKNIENFIKMIDEKTKKYILNNVAIFGFGWSDNIDNNTYENITYANGIPLNNNTDKIADYNFKVILINNLIVPNKSNKNIAWESTLINYAQEQSKYHKNDLFLSSIDTGIAYINPKYKNLFSATYDHVWVGGDQTLYIYGLKNNLRYLLSKKDILSFTLKYQKKKMIKIEDRHRDAHIRNLGLNYTHIVDKNNKLNFLSDFTKERKRKGIRTDVSKDVSKYKISYDTKLFNVDFNLGYQYEKSKYLEIITALDSKRIDRNTNINFNISKQLSKTKILSLELNNINMKSNINTYTYKKKSATLNYTILF